MGMHLSTSHDLAVFPVERWDLSMATVIAEALNSRHGFTVGFLDFKGTRRKDLSSWKFCLGQAGGKVIASTFNFRYVILLWI